MPPESLRPSRVPPPRGPTESVFGDETVEHAIPPTTWEAERARSWPWMPPAVPTTVVVPHPDDEALLFGGLVALQRARGVEVTVIAVTDGEAAYPGADASELAEIRRREQEQSLAWLGVDPSHVRRLHVPDGEVPDHLDRVVDAVAALATPLVVAPWEYDHHSDHEACGRAAQIGASRHGAAVWSGLFWTWHRTAPACLGEHRLVHLALDAPTRSARRSALAAHRSQLERDVGEPVLTSELLEPVSWDREYFVAPMIADLEATA